MSRCGLCNRRLQDHESIELGFGPTCWARLSATLSTEAVPGPWGLPVAPAAPPRPEASPAPEAADREDGPPARDPALAVARPAQVASPALAGVGWLVVLAALVALVEYWRWLVVGLAVLAVLAVVGLAVERLGTRGSAPGTSRPGGRSHRF